MKNTKLLLLVALLTFASTRLSRADSTANVSTTPLVVKGGKNLTQTFKVWGATDELAQQEALERARRFLEGYGEHRQPPRSWSLTTAEVQKHFLKSLQAHPEQDKLVQGEVVKCWSATIVATPEQLAALDRQARTHERMGLLGKVMLLAVLGTAAMGGYLRFEEWTQWRSTFVPRLAGAGLLAALGTGIWMSL